MLQTGGWFSGAEINDLATHLNLPIDEFTNQYLELHDGKFVLKSRDVACIFLENDVCTVYEARPIQCRTFPFWPANLKSLYRWKIIMLECEGIGQGKHYSRSEIETIIKTQSATEIGPSREARHREI